MRVLLDTNIFIRREDIQILPEELQRLIQILNELNAKILIHPKSLDEIKHDANEERRKIVLSKVSAYSTLESPPDPTSDPKFSRIVGKATKQNDIVDNLLLYTIYKNAADFLITEDKDILKKARDLGISDTVLSIDDAIATFERYLPPPFKISYPPLKQEPVYNLDITDPFFNSLKESYGKDEFESWLKRISKEGRQCLVHKVDKKIGALLIYKVEEEPIDAEPPLPKKKRLKLCTFKVASTGSKIGELFIKYAVSYALKNNIEELYLTHFTESNDHLVSLITEYGFNNVAKKPNGEDIFLKNLTPSKNLSPQEISKKCWPYFYDGLKVRKFVVPIRPEYHERLFVDFRNRQSTINEYKGEFIVEGNTIEKAYLCHSKILQMHPGDILLFYRSKDLHAITSLGVIQKILLRERDPDKIIRFVGRRTVYSIDEIKKMVKKPIIVILFTWHQYLKYPLKLEKLQEYNIVSGAPQTILPISHQKYLTLKKKGDIDVRFAIN